MNDRANDTMPRRAKGPIAAAPVLDGILQTVAETVSAWPGVRATVHWHLERRTEVDGADFYVGEEELGHIHLDGYIHLATSPALGAELIASGLARSFPYGRGWVQERIGTIGVDAAVALFRRNYQRLATKIRAEESCMRTLIMTALSAGLVVFAAAPVASQTPSYPMPAAVNGGDDAAQIKRLSQAFSDASATNDVPVLAKLLDDRVTFMNEDGKLATKADVASKPPVPNTSGNTRILTQRDFVVRFFGSTAVTSFTDHLAQHAYGQTQTADFRSTEVWSKETGSWKMISSQTIAEQVDPPAISLPVRDIAAYVGTYVAGPGLSVKIQRSGNRLSASINGAQATAMKAEVRDVFFTPGIPRVRRIFERNANGTIIAFVSRHEGHGFRFVRS